MALHNFADLFKHAVVVGRLRCGVHSTYASVYFNQSDTFVSPLCACHMCTTPPATGALHCSAERIAWWQYGLPTQMSGNEPGGHVLTMAPHSAADWSDSSMTVV